MEDLIAEKRKTLGSLDYQHWFQRNYPSLHSEVEGVYTEWIVFGQKDLVELYKTSMDTESSGVNLGEARATLRSSGFSSTDRTQMIYPVAFEPSDFYKYIKTGYACMYIVPWHCIRSTVHVIMYVRTT